MEKDPQARLDYAVNWTPQLVGGDAITTSTWEITPTGLTVDSPAPSIAGGFTTIWLSGGTVGDRYWITNHIATSQGRLNDQTFSLLIVPK